jgi:hypothetical protein
VSAIDCWSLFLLLLLLLLLVCFGHLAVCDEVPQLQPDVSI